MFKLEIETDNDAFNDCKEEEVARILEEAAYKLRGGYDNFTLNDCNGNRVGLAGFVKEDE